MKKIISYGLALCAILLVSCEKDLYEDSGRQSEKVTVTGKTNVVSIKDVPFLNTEIENYKSKMTSKGIEDYILDLDHIKEFANANGYKSYSIAIIENFGGTDDYYFKNLILINIDDNWRPFIVKYNPEDDTKKIDFALYTGKIEFMGIDKDTGSTIYYQDGNKLIPVAPPFGNPEDIGGSGGDNPDGPPPSWMPGWMADLLGYPYNNDGLGGSSSLIHSIIAAISESCGCNNNSGYVLVATPINLGTYTGNNDPQQSTSGPGVTIAPNIPQWPAYVPNVHIRRNLIAARLSGLPEDVKSWFVTNSTDEQSQNIFSYLIEYDYTDAEANNFAIEAIKAIHLGGTVNFPNEVILDPTFESNIKAKCVMQKLLSLDMGNHFKNTIVNLFDSSDRANVKFLIRNLPQPSGGQSYDAVTVGSSVYITQNHSMFYILLDSNFIANASTIEIAMTIMHELIHAELMQRCIDLGIVTSISFNPTTYDGNIAFANGTQLPLNQQSAIVNSLIQFYNTCNVPTQWNHDLMTTLSYRNTIAQDLVSAYPLLNDPNNSFITNINSDTTNPFGNFTLQQAMDFLSWTGLESTQLYFDATSTNPSQLNAINYISGASRTKFTQTCN